MNIVEVEARCSEVLAALSRIIVGKDDVLRRLMAGILANGHKGLSPCVRGHQ